MKRTSLMSLVGAAAIALMSNNEIVSNSNFTIKPKKRNKLSSYMTNVNKDTTDNALDSNSLDKIDKAKMKRAMKNIKRIKSLHK